MVHNTIEEFSSNRWQNFLYNPVVIVAYKLDLRYYGNHLNACTFDPIIEKEIIQLAGEEYKNIVLEELAEYVGKIGGRYPVLSDIAIRILSIPPMSASSERNWSTFGFIYTKLRNRLHEKRGWVDKVLRNKPIDEAADGDNEQKVDVESDFSDLNFQLYSDIEELSSEELNEFQD
ncbi:zinc finger BED domain-containing protein 1-like [Rhizophagus clarus]|uniref:Zinc finger BED domain-containing protein 1-like n=1 Tax=Rhizophagus clarus TaxID=94130 RepID=A0A8H3LUT3_9GLOM|nr:zinc finger BED domain-containing protein 1-like [Rhizophagus clarus]